MSSRRAVDEEGVCNRRNTFHDPSYPLRVESQSLKDQTDELPLKSIVGFAHVGFNRHGASFFHLGAKV
uniref:Uncharacterized protein n=1 Tax=Brassica oleracea var. oleracea TaxID=109376 RepID=A0A0D2ZQ86_BRAOL